MRLPRGQQINMEKSSIFFSKNTSEVQKDVVRNAIGISSVEHHGKYLGLPALISKSKKVIFNYIKERLWKRLQGWKGKLLSKAGKEVLIKAVVQAIPSYVMSCFKLPNSFCDEMKSMISNFWWGQNDTDRKIHWLSWSRLCESKIKRGRCPSFTWRSIWESRNLVCMGA